MGPKSNLQKQPWSAARGHLVETFANGRDFLSSNEARCLLLDLQLGDMSGLDLAHQLKMTGSNRPIIFITGAEDDELRRQCLDFGCVAFLRKPPQGSELIDAIAEALQVTGDPLATVDLLPPNN